VAHGSLEEARSKRADAQIVGGFCRSGALSAVAPPAVIAFAGFFARQLYK